MDSQSKLPEASLNVMVLDPILLTGVPGLGVYLILDFSRYSLSESTLLDNCSVMYMVNNVRILDEGIFINERSGCTVKAGSSSLPIISCDTCTIKCILNGKNDKVDLVLRDVIVVEGFHMNIVSEALLYKKGIWYYGLDRILKMGDEYKNVILL